MSESERRLFDMHNHDHDILFDIHNHNHDILERGKMSLGKRGNNQKRPLRFKVANGEAINLVINQ